MPTTHHEDERLKELQRYYILDTQPEKIFDEITKLAATVCDTKVAVIGLLDKDRQWYKSQYGVNVSEVPRELSFSEYVIEQDDIFIVPDISADKRFKKIWPISSEKNVTFYAGVPLTTPNGHKIGILAVADSKGRELSESQINVLKSLARHVVDILELRSKSRELARLESQYHDVQKITKTGGWELDVLTQEVNWSHEIYEIFQIPKGSTTNLKEISFFFSPYDRERILEMISKSIYEGKPFHGDFEFIDGLGVKKWIRSIGRPVLNDQGKIIRLVGTFQDITESRKSQINYLKRKAESEQKYSSLLESMSEGVFILDSTGTIIQHNTSAMAITGLSADELAGKTKIRPQWRAIREDGSDFRFRDHPAITALKTGKSFYNVKMGIRINENETRWISLNAVPREYPDGKRVLCTFSNITALVQANEENKFVLETLGIGVWKSNLGVRHGIIWDHSMYKLYGVSPRDFDSSQEAWLNLLTPESQMQVNRIMEQIQSGVNDFTTTYELKSENNGIKFVGGRGRVIRNSNGEPKSLYGITWDKTKEVELEKNFEHERAKALHNSKLASIGQLAAGVGHEINNPLSIIAGHIRIAEHLLLNAGIEKNDLLDRFLKVTTAVNRIANIVKGLRTFARSDDNQISRFDIYEPLKETIDLLKEIYEKEGVELNLLGERRGTILNGNRGRLQQVMVNLISNAKDATVGRDSRKIDVSVGYGEDSLELKFSDNGSGIPAEIRNKVFEPFFTTKPINQGTGIGLSLVTTIVKEHNGRIELDSELNKGTTFTLTFPVEFTSQEHLDVPSKVLQTDNKISCKVLVVDDEADLQDILLFLFSKVCTFVRTAGSVQHALNIMEDEQFDLIVSDVDMPEINGFSFFEIVRAKKHIRQPKFIFITGRMDFTKEQELIFQEEALEVLSKPFKEEFVNEKLKELFPEKFSKKN